MNTAPFEGRREVLCYSVFVPEYFFLFVFVPSHSVNKCSRLKLRSCNGVVGEADQKNGPRQAFSSLSDQPLRFSNPGHHLSLSVQDCKEKRMRHDRQCTRYGSYRIEGNRRTEEDQCGQP